MPNREERRRMEKRVKQNMKRNHATPPNQVTPVVSSLLDAMRDGQEYTSIVSCAVPQGTDLTVEIKRAIQDVEKLRNRPCLVYAGNIISPVPQHTNIEASDDLPFLEMVGQVPAEYKEADIFLVTNGGSGEQVNNFVNALRPRFDDVAFLIPSFCMSAGTLFALSGDSIWMTPSARLGPIDPQIPTKDGRYVPAQALMSMISRLQAEGQSAMSKGQPVPWSAVRLIDSLDKKELAHALTATAYSTQLATEYLTKYKFKTWKTPKERADRAAEIAHHLASHNKWKAHGHAIRRALLWDELRLKIDHPDSALERAMARLWALIYWTFDKSPAVKLIISKDTVYVRNNVMVRKDS